MRKLDYTTHDLNGTIIRAIREYRDNLVEVWRNEDGSYSYSITSTAKYENWEDALCDARKLIDGIEQDICWVPLVKIRGME